MRDLENRDPAEVRTVFFLILMYVFLVADTMLINPNQILIMKEFGRDEADVGLISTMFIFLGAGIALPWGYFADRYRRKELIALTIIIGEIPCLLTGFVRTYNELLVVRALTGFGVGGILPLLYSTIGDTVSDKERSTAAAWLGLAEGIGTAIGFMLAGNQSKLPFDLFGVTGWRLPFVLVALPNLFIVPLFLMFAKEPARGGGEASIKDEISKGLEYKRRIKLSDYPAMFKNKTNLLAFLQGVPGTIGWGVLPAWMVTFYNQSKGVPIDMATNLMMLVGVGMIVGGMTGGIWGNRIHAKSKQNISTFCGITTLLGIAFFFVMIHYPLPDAPTIRDMTLPLIAGSAAGFFIAMTGANIRAMVMNVNPPENRGAMMSLFSITDSIGKGAGPLLGGVLIVSIGYVPTMDISNVFWIPCALVFLLFLRRQYPVDAVKLEKLMAERAVEMERDRAG